MLISSRPGSPAAVQGISPAAVCRPVLPGFGIFPFNVGGAFLRRHGPRKAGGSGDPPLRGNFGPAWYGGSPSAAEDRFSCHFVGEGLAPPVISLEGLSLYAVGVGHRPARRVTTAEIRSRAIRRARLVLHRANPPAQRESGTFSGPPPAGRVDFFKMPLTFPLVEGVS